MNNCLPPPNYIDLIKKENAWIVFKTNNDGKITELEVYELNPNDELGWEKIVNKIERTCEPFQDTGRFLTQHWQKTTFSKLLFDFGWNYGFANEDYMKKAWNSLMNVEEFREEAIQWNEANIFQ